VCGYRVCCSVLQCVAVCCSVSISTERVYTQNEETLVEVGSQAEREIERENEKKKREKSERERDRERDRERERQTDRGVDFDPEWTREREWCVECVAVK